VRGDLNKTKALLNGNPDLVFSRSDNGDTPLHAAAMKGHRDVAELLLTDKADVNAKNNDNVTALLFTAVFDHRDIAELLIANEADINAANKNGGTPLAAAAQWVGRTWRSYSLRKVLASISSLSPAGHLCMKLQTKAIGAWRGCYLPTEQV